MRDALSLLDQVIAFTSGTVNIEDTSFLLGSLDTFISQELFESIIKEDVDKVVTLINKITEQGLEYRTLNESLIEHTRNSLFLVLSNTLPIENLTANEKEFYDNLKKFLSHQRLYAIFQIFIKLSQDLKYFDFHKYIFEFAIFKATTISQVIPIDHVTNYDVNPNAIAKKVEVPIIPTINEDIEDKKKR